MDKTMNEDVSPESALSPAVLSQSGLSSGTVLRMPPRRVLKKTTPPPDMVCFSHLRWDFVFQRPQHLLTRFCREGRVFYFEEPVYDSETPWLDIRKPGPESLWIAVPHLPEGRDRLWQDATVRQLLDELMESHTIRDYLLWYYTPLALGYSSHLRPCAIVYDCMDELSNFRFAPPLLKDREAELFRRADLVFTGGQSLYEAKRSRHSRVYCFPSSVDVDHFKNARTLRQDPKDQALLPHPRLGFYGVLDERIDFGLIRTVAAARPDWQIILIGPVCKLGQESLPRLHNIHYLGARPYRELPVYVAGWDVALLPFARNASTKLISPTKTPEYLAAGRPVVSTAVRDVVRPYGDRGLVYIAENGREFVRAVDRALELRRNGKAWLEEVDAFLSLNSWDRTWREMRNLVVQAVGEQVRSGALA